MRKRIEWPTATSRLHSPIEKTKKEILADMAIAAVALAAVGIATYDTQSSELDSNASSSNNEYFTPFID